ELHRLDGRGYKAYKGVAGRYAFSGFTLFIDHVQGDPFASPSRLRVRVPREQAGYPAEADANASRRVGLENFLALAFARAIRAAGGRYPELRRGSGKSGLLAIDAPGQEMLQRTAIAVTDAFVEARFVAGLPARGRTILGRAAAEMLGEALPEVVEESLFYSHNDQALLWRFVETAEDADALRAKLDEQGLVAFVADGSILPRRSGVDPRPLPASEAVPFQSPPSLRQSFALPNAGAVSGMGIPAGVTLIVGGGFHGKSTLLNAVERGVYNHRPGDGREKVVTVESAVKIRAEDGRYVAGVDISAFIANLPFGRDTLSFDSANASGSTSQAANISEALSLGARLLLIDEDTAATNFMIRDRRMQALITREKEPITPFIDRVRSLCEEHGVSTILVIGGSGDYFDVADHVVAMEAYHPVERTEEARAIAAADAQAREAPDPLQPPASRVPLPGSVDPSRGRRRIRVQARGPDTILFGEETIDLSAVEQIVDPSQTRAIAHALVHAWENYMDGERTLVEIVDRVMADVENRGLDVLTPYLVADLAAFRRFELAAALNRLRTLEVRR
ncbi:MAG: ABC-ATPase domain-containing protein, partial [Candidatus Promineifilaceae bacterium]|nr:ABC-ATPase domain-containing protein [Candidatus Promineifilaceae bacterium]